MAVLATPPFLQFFDDNGDPLSGGLVYTYTAGTTTPKATYTTAAGDIENTNPVELDAAGRGDIWINGAYKFIVKTSAGTTIRTVDNITAFTNTSNDADPFFQSFSGTGAQTAFTLSESLGTDEKTIMVFVDAGAGKGFDIYAPTAYTLSGTSLTFNVAPASGTNNIYVFATSLLLGAAAASAAAADASATTASNAANVAQAVSRGYAYDYSSAVTATDPTAGKLKLNNAVLSLASALYVSDTTDDAFNIGDDFATWDDSTSTIRGRIRIVSQGTPTTFALYNLTGSVVDNTGWRTMTISYVDGNGTLANNDAVTISFVATGDKGSTGPSGSGSGDMVAATYDPANIAQQVVGTTAAQTMTNKTFTGVGGFHTLSFAANGDYVIYLSAQHAETLTNFVGISSDSGTIFNADLKIGASTTASLTTVSNVEENDNTFSDSSVALGEKLSVTISSFTGSGSGNVYIHSTQTVLS